MCGVIKPLVKRVVVSHPKSLARIARDPRKYDKRDARKLADLSRGGLTHEVFLPETLPRRAFKQLVRHYDGATRAQAKFKSRIKARLRCQGIIRRDGAVFGKIEREAVLSQIEDKFLPSMFQALFATLDHLLDDMKQARQPMLEAARRFPEVRLLQSAPGVGTIGACRFVAYIQDPRRFSNNRKLWRYRRLGVTRRESNGRRLAHPRLDAAGVGSLKDVSRKIFEAARRTKSDNSFKRFYKISLANTKNAVHALLSTQRKILACLRAMWIGNQPFRNDLINKTG